MSFVSAVFPLFLAASVLVYYLLPKRFRWLALLIASFVFYLAGGVKTVGFLLFTVLTTWAAGLGLEALNAKRKGASKAEQARIKGQKKALCALALLLNFGMLFALKYLDFTASALANALGRFGIAWTPRKLGLLLPLGVSFFIFQTVGYVIDQFRGKYPAQRNPAKFALFAAFFPQMVQGPISRYDELAPRLLEGNDFDAENLRSGIQRILWGYLKKMVVADRAAVLVNYFFANHAAYGGAMVLFSMLIYCIQLYCDFSGGIDVAIGAGELFGVRLAENFQRPIFATSLAEYWRRWHITLGTWMRDYVFYPLTLSRPFGKLNKWARKHVPGKLGKIVSTSLATFIVYLLIGLWHGANFRYIAFGVWNGGIITLSIALKNVFHTWREALHIDPKNHLWRGVSMVRTALIVFVGRFITRSPRLLTAAELLRRCVSPGRFRLGELLDGAALRMGLTGSDLTVIGLGTAILLAVEIFQEYRGPVRPALAKQRAIIQWLAMLLPMAALLLLGLLRGSYIASEFIYRQY